MKLVIAALAGILLRETYAWLPEASRWLIERAVRRLPAGAQERWREEWSAHSDALPISGVKVIHALSLHCAARQINIEMLEASLREGESSRAQITLTDIGFGYSQLVRDIPRKHFNMDFIAFDPEITALSAVVDSAWLADIEAKFGSTTIASLRATRFEGVPRDVQLLDENGMARCTLRDVFAEFTQQMQSGKLLLSHRAKKTFSEPAFLRSHHPLVPLIKIHQISATVELYPTVYKNFGTAGSAREQ